MSTLRWTADPNKSISIPSTTKAGNFYLQGKITVTEPMIDHVVILGDDDNLSYLRIDSDHSVKMKYAGGTKGSATGIWPNDGQEHDLYINRDGSNHLLKVDNVSVYASATANTGDCTFTQIGSRQDEYFMRGTIKDLDINSDRFYPIQDGWPANPVIADTAGGNKDGTAIGFAMNDWIGEIISSVRRILINVSYGNVRVEEPPVEPPVEPPTGDNAWIIAHFAGDPEITGHTDDRTTVNAPALIHDGTGSILNDTKYVFDLRSTNGSDIGIMNFDFGAMTSNDAYGSPIKVNNGIGDVFISNVTSAPGWPDWIDYNNTNYDGIDFDASSNSGLYAENLFIDDWNADAALDMKATNAQIVNLQILGGGHRALRIWSSGDVFLMDSSISNDTGDDLLWFGENATNTGMLYIWNCDFEGSSVCPANRLDADTGTPNITYLTEDPRLGGPHYPMHPMFYA